MMEGQKEAEVHSKRQRTKYGGRNGGEHCFKGCQRAVILREVDDTESRKVKKSEYVINSLHSTK